MKYSKPIKPTVKWKCVKCNMPLGYIPKDSVCPNPTCKWDRDDDKYFNWVIGIGVTVLIAFAVVEVALIGASFIFADKIECNWIWCTFSSTRSEGYSSFVSTQDCFINGEIVNCSSSNNIECVNRWKPNFCESLYDDVKKRLANGEETMDECFCFYSPKNASVVHK